MPWHFTATTNLHNHVPLDQKPICSTAYYSETLQPTTMDFQDSESPLFQKYTFSNYWGPLRVQDNGATEQWWDSDLDLESSGHRFAERTKGLRLKGSSFILEPTYELHKSSTFSALLQLDGMLFCTSSTWFTHYNSGPPEIKYNVAVCTWWQQKVTSKSPEYGDKKKASSVTAGGLHWLFTKPDADFGFLNEDWSASRNLQIQTFSGIWRIQIALVGPVIGQALDLCSNHLSPVLQVKHPLLESSNSGGTAEHENNLQGSEQAFINLLQIQSSICALWSALFNLHVGVASENPKRERRTCIRPAFALVSLFRF